MSINEYSLDKELVLELPCAEEMSLKDKDDLIDLLSSFSKQRSLKQIKDINKSIQG